MDATAQGKIQRFDFGNLRDFRRPIEFLPEAPVIEDLPPSPPPPSFSEYELQLARDEGREAGYQEGFLAGEAQAKAAVDAQTQQSQQTLIALLDKLTGLEASYAATLAEQSRLLGDLSLTIARKVAGAALNENTSATINELITRCLPMVMLKPRLRIELHPDTLATTEQALRAMLSAQHYEGQVVVRANVLLAPHDARIDWENGHAERSTTALWEEIENLMQQIPMHIELLPPTTNNITE